MKKSDLPNVLLLEIDDLMYKLMEKIMEFKGELKFSLTRAKYAEDVLKRFEEGEKFDAVAFHYNGWSLSSYHVYDMAKQVRDTHPDLPIIASICCGLCFPEELRKELRLYETDDYGGSVSWDELNKGLKACGVISA